MFVQSDVTAKSRGKADDTNPEVRGQGWRKAWVLRDYTRLNNGSRDIYVLTPGILEGTVSGKGDFADGINSRVSRCVILAGLV